MIWQISNRADPRARELADRHYNRQKPGTPQFVQPSRCLSNSIRGNENRTNGKIFENQIETTLQAYSFMGLAEIEKTPEPMRVIHSIQGGKFVACFEKKAQPDFKGVVKGGVPVIFDAKFTKLDRLSQSAVTEEQDKILTAYAKMGAKCFIIASISGKLFRIPWGVFREMKKIYGRKYVTENDLEQYKIEEKNGVPDILGIM